MHLEFLWDDEKTRKLHRTQLLIYLFGSIIAFVYGFILSDKTFQLQIIETAIFTFGVGVFGFLTLNKPNQGLRMLSTYMLGVAAVSYFMVYTGGFHSIMQFVPIAILFLTVFQLGSSAALVIAVYTIIMFLMMFIWQLLNDLHSSTIPDFIFFVTVYLLIVIFQRNVGQELSLQLEARQKLEQVDDIKNQFIALASHFLRTPLTVIKGATDELEKIKLTDEQHTLVEDIRASTLSLDTLVEKFLTIASIERGVLKITPIPASDLNQLIHSVVLELQPLATQRQVSLSYDSAVPIPKFSFDPAKIKQVIAGLLNNALNYNKPSGNVIISTDLQADLAKIMIKDNGIGINKEHLSSLFSSFNRGGMDRTLQFDQPGAGLSLYLTKLIVEAHGGKITVESEIGQGTNFTISLPLKNVS